MVYHVFKKGKDFYCNQPKANIQFTGAWLFSFFSLNNFVVVKNWSNRFQLIQSIYNKISAEFFNLSEKNFLLQYIKKVNLTMIKNNKKIYFNKEPYYGVAICKYRPSV